MSTIAYLRNFIKDRNVASVTPSSKICVRHVCKKIDFGKTNVIVEYGPGMGVFTKYLLKHLNEGSRIIAIELNPNFAEKLKKIKDSRLIVYNESVEKVTELVQSSGYEKVDYILSGIPFSFLSDDVRLDVLQQTKKLLKIDGKFLAYQTSGHLKKPIKTVFNNLHTEFELLNVPPMIIYETVKR